MHQRGSNQILHMDPELVPIDWDDFPRLFFYNSHNTYLIGLDPTYMQLYNAGLYDSWVDITNGNVKKPITNDLSFIWCRLRLTHLNHKNFISTPELSKP